MRLIRAKGRQLLVDGVRMAQVEVEAASSEVEWWFEGFGRHVEGDFRHSTGWPGRSDSQRYPG